VSGIVPAVVVRFSIPDELVPDDFELGAQRFVEAARSARVASLRGVVISGQIGR
jgi:hypothetical protein